ncbi:MAG: FtsQ-type POTRA domain-containing protein [Deltaproteobacteria bacterium]|nr:FtsQ-type POTRA domain-containing protein [Deltaproteobacteria bacterium]MCB9478739.1 FtsQ-type POTRA domain-containing protein [Deltaproteobacteria bacterium]MCB9488255.1 FtsQ-type POTRA domain-containing protein [Deltaproteobacteria bacterium]
MNWVWFNRLRRRRGNIKKVDRKIEIGQKLARLSGLARPALGLAVVIAATLWAIDAICASSLFGVTKLQLSQTRHVDQSEVKRYLDIYPRQNIFTVELRESHRRLIDHPWVAGARVQRVLPNKIRIDITERVPVAQIYLTADDSAPTEEQIAKATRREAIDNLYFVDAGGEIFKQVTSEEAALYPLPIITGFKRGSFLDEHTGKLHRNRLTQAVALLNHLRRDAGIGLERLSEIRFDESTGFALYLDGAQTLVQVGLPPYHDAFARLAAVLEHLGPQAQLARRIDLSQPGRAVVKGLREKSAS